MDIFDGLRTWATALALAASTVVGANVTGTNGAGANVTGTNGAGANVIGGAAAPADGSATRTAALACRPALLPVPAGVGQSKVTGGDHSGRHLVGTGLRSDGGVVGLRWTDGRVSEVDTTALQPFASVDLTDVSAAGVVGYRTIDTSSFRTEAFVLRGGKVTRLPGLRPTDETEARAINSRGDIIGVSKDFSGTTFTTHAVVWPAHRPGTVRELVADGPEPTWVSGVDIDDDGTALGFVGRRPTAGQHPYVWPAVGKGRALTAPAGYTYPEGTAIRAGWVSGTAFDANGNGAVLRWHLSHGRANVLPGSFGGVGVNAHGTVITNVSIIRRDGRVSAPDGYLTTVDDRGVVAGATDALLGRAATWSRC